MLPNGDYGTDLTAIVIVIVPEIIVANAYVLLSSDSVKTDDVSDCGNNSYVHNNEDNTRISGGVVCLRNTK